MASGTRQILRVPRDAGQHRERVAAPSQPARETCHPQAFSLSGLIELAARGPQPPVVVDEREVEGAAV
jgi:hypothetical protein